MQRRNFLYAASLVAASGGLGFAAMPAAAQGNWPTGRTITYVVPFAAGGVTDIVSKIHSRSKNKLTIARATVAALKKLQPK